jgi:hypothetical protein
MAGEDWTFWFNMTNYALGMITLLAVLVVFGALGWDVVLLWLHKARRAERLDLQSAGADLRAMWRSEPHSLSVPGLGLTMADGGERVEPSEPEASEEKKPRK